MMKRIGVVGIVGGWSSERLVSAVEKEYAACRLVDAKKIALDLAGGRLRCNGEDLSGFDALIVKKLGANYAAHHADRLRLLAFAAERGLPVFSSPRRILLAFDRLSCTLTLRMGGVPIPPTVVTEDLVAAEAAIREFGRAVLKPLFTSKARGMELIRPGDDVAGRLAAFRDAGNATLYIQKLIPLPQRDLSVAFLGGEYLATYARVRGGDSWSTTTHFGGRYEPCEPSPEVIAVARKSAELFGLDFTCVDVAEGPEGPVVFEVSPFGGFRGLFNANGIDAARLYADYVLRKLEHA
jgi:ATP-grasp enzyme of GAK system